MPAPPLESDPAMVTAIGVICRCPYLSPLAGKGMESQPGWSEAKSAAPGQYGNAAPGLADAQPRLRALATDAAALRRSLLLLAMRPDGRHLWGMGRECRVHDRAQLVRRRSRVRTVRQR